MTPSGTSLLGLVKHLANTEYNWFSETFGRETEPLHFDDDDPDADLRPEPHETTADLVAFYADGAARRAPGCGAGADRRAHRRPPGPA